MKGGHREEDKKQTCFTVNATNQSPRIEIFSKTKTKTIIIVECV